MSEGIELFIDNDTIERTDKKKIGDIFVADITPITTLSENKEKSNVLLRLFMSMVLRQYAIRCQYVFASY